MAKLSGSVVGTVLDAGRVVLMAGVVTAWCGSAWAGSGGAPGGEGGAETAGVVETRADAAAEGRAIAERAIEYFRETQGESGGWSAPEGEGRPHLPAITALVLTGMLLDPAVDHTDPAVERGVAYLLSHQQSDGGIYDRILPAYNTALSVSALSQVETDEAREAVRKAVPFLRSLQWHEGAASLPSTGRVGREHPFYGGVGYGGSSRPDNSNLNLWLQAMHDAGVPGDDPAFQRALVFLARTQMLDSVNDMPYAEGSQQGGFIYATSPSAEEMGVGESKAGTMVETLSDGTTASRLRSYGSMTYAGFKSLIYADLDRDDERLRAAWRWIGENYTLEENPGIGTDGYYYFLITFGRALSAWGAEAVETRGDAIPLRLWVPMEPWPLPAGGWIDYVNRGETEDGEVIEFDEPIATLSAYHSTDGSSYRRTEGRLASGERWALAGTEISLGDRVGGRVAFRDEAGNEYVEGSAAIVLIENRDWRRDLIGKLAEMQEGGGAFRPVDDRWMEDNPVLITAYSLIGLQHARASLAGSAGG